MGHEFSSNPRVATSSKKKQPDKVSLTDERLSEQDDVITQDGKIHNDTQKGVMNDESIKLLEKKAKKCAHKANFPLCFNIVDKLIEFHCRFGENSKEMSDFFERIIKDLNAISL